MKTWGKRNPFHQLRWLWAESIQWISLLVGVILDFTIVVEATCGDGFVLCVFYSIIDVA